jgi:flagellin
MGISINTNIPATRAGFHLANNHQAMQKSLDRLSSGKRITEPADDAGGLAVSMKIESLIKRLLFRFRMGYSPPQERLFPEWES